MLQKKIAIVMLILSIGGALFSGCYKNTVVMSDTVDEITRPVSFNNDIVPIFNKSCNNSACHSAGGIAPNLTPANAHGALGTRYINTGDPQNSELYLWMVGKKGTPMPLSGPDKNYNALVLAWIKQGALNN